MGAGFAPDIANLYMDHYEDKYTYNIDNPFIENITLWKRYIDDIFLIWTGTSDALEEFCGWLNGRSRDIQLTMAYSEEQIHFLDLTVKIEENMLYTPLYRKPLERNTLLGYTSNHPRNLRDNLPYGQFLRLCRNCSRRSDFFTESDSLLSRLIERGYPRSLLKKARK